jgi:hypothetical protein
MRPHAKCQSESKNAESRAGGWFDTALGILYVVDGEVQFADDHDHFKNGFCRLLEVKPDQSRHLVEESVAAGFEKYDKLFSRLPDEQRLDCVGIGIRRCFGGDNSARNTPLFEEWGTDLDGAAADTVFAGAISGDPSRLVVGNSISEFAWLVNANTNLRVLEDSTVYDTGYYQGNVAHCGYSQYAAQADWRLEKAARLVRTVLHNSGYRQRKWLESPGEVKVLDVGAGIGYMRNGFADLGFQHYGIEVSADIIRASSERFGYDTWSGGVYGVPDFAKGMKFDIITLWDVIEHFDDPRRALKLLVEYLVSDGLLVVRTPNLMSTESMLLGDYYYSFKFDHLCYFSPKSLSQMMESLGLKPVYVETVSHLLKGLLGANLLFSLGQQMRGADILAIYSRES